ncbi:MAG TPA: flagellar basal body-associated FliL family protein [Thermoleophilaceae bacterium]|jgi:flagellar basal body-associated protein FliL|nr:flagellar basal body-associated FliL family protein [Thermoleophilaceae bacterium]
MKGKKKFIVPLVVLILLGGVYKTVLAKPPAKDKAKIDGTVYVLPKDFLLNMADGKYAKLSVALILNKSEILPATEGAPSADAAYGSLEQEPAVRDVITNVLTDANSNELVQRAGREKLKEEVLKQIRATTDVKVDKVLFTDVAVQ